MSKPVPLSYSIKNLVEELQVELDLPPDLINVKKYPYWKIISEALHSKSEFPEMDLAEESWSDQTISREEAISGAVRETIDEIIQLKYGMRQLKYGMRNKLTELSELLAKNVTESEAFNDASHFLDIRFVRRKMKRKFLRESTRDYFAKCTKANISQGTEGEWDEEDTHAQEFVEDIKNESEEDREEAVE